MRLRNRQYQGVQRPTKQRPKKPRHTSFTLFPKLPTEIRHMIWRFSLQPRTIEIQEQYHNSAYFCPYKLPSALSTCRDSREAVIELYPYCFSSRTKSPAIRFNFSLDTLFLGTLMEESALHLLDILTDKELSSIRHVAVGEILGWNDRIDSAQPIFWSNLEKPMKAFTGLEDLRIVLDVFHCTRTSLEIPYSDDEFDYLLEFFDEYPAELLTGQKPVKECDLIDTWTNSKLKLVWGWRRSKYPKYV